MNNRETNVEPKLGTREEASRELTAEELELVSGGESNVGKKLHEIENAVVKNF